MIAKAKAISVLAGLLATGGVTTAATQGLTNASNSVSTVRVAAAPAASASANADEDHGAAARASASPAPCPSDVKNHGEYMRGVAKAAKSLEPGPERGALISASAQSDCGKPEGAGDESASPSASPARGKSAEHKPEDAGKPSDAGKPTDVPRNP